MLFNATNSRDAILATTNLTTWNGPGGASGWGYDVGISAGSGYSLSWE
jgi:hypothetical protein